MRMPYKIIELDTVDSTNNYAKRELLGIENRTVIKALSQTSGRGQRGNVWKSDAGRNLLLSVVIKYNSDNCNFQIPASSQMAISCMTALSVVKALESLHIEARIKWPNDIYIGDRKVCGILIENSINGSLLSSSIIGVGINVNQLDFDDDIPNPISLAQCTGLSYDIDEVMLVFLHEFDKLLTQFAYGRMDYELLRSIYTEHLWQLNRTREFIDRRSPQVTPFTGMIRGILNDGRLVIETDGGTREFAFNEVSYLRTNSVL